MYEEIFIAGSGGQGVLSLGKILVYSAAKENKLATYYPSYGAEVRGGTANCMVKISESFIFSPIIENPTIVTLMNMPSYLKFIKKFIPQKFLFINTSLIEEQEEIKKFLKHYSKNLEIIKVAATEIANKIGSTVVSNIVMLGAIARRTEIIKITSIKETLYKIFSKKILDINLKALDIGYEI
ncbi:MAG: 2-oxoacid:acceptor oxidoreductase family protein [Elusimicrobiota bacterium]|nr:2-oxoacid:acceptor oxidoreductase family protein [Endomicrobiia bacterium]MDW8165624.1 2-oxoacid:acceptor oxidoreductase family protein [Elusimicrobiota bacterium]